jgi:hypothetical protein
MAPTPKPQAVKKAAGAAGLNGSAPKSGSKDLTDSELKQLKSGGAARNESGGGAKVGKPKLQKPPRPGSRSKDKGGVNPVLLIGAGLVAALAWVALAGQFQGATPPRSEAGGSRPQQQRTPKKSKEPTPHELRQQGRQVPGSDRPKCADRYTGGCGSVSEQECETQEVKARCWYATGRSNRRRARPRQEAARLLTRAGLASDSLTCFKKTCVDRDPSCIAWAQKGQCYLNAAYMNATCCFACSPDPEDRCSPDPSQRPDVAEGDLSAVFERAI